MKRLWQWVRAHLIPVHLLTDVERIGDRWGVLIYRADGRVFSIGLLFYITIPVIRSEWDFYERRQVFGRPRYFARCGVYMPWNGVPAECFAHRGCQLEEK